jgi:predicted ABC-type ATPase
MPPETSNSPKLIIVGGSNGSGKTTLARVMVETYGFRYLGADEFAFKMNPLDVESVQVPAAKMFIREIECAISNRESIIVESTLSGLTLIKHIKNAKKNGYQVMCAYIYLDSVEISILRVQLRVKQGGHNVPENDIRRRFPRSRLNFWNSYRPICHSWELYYNSPEEQNKDIDLVAYAKVSEDEQSEELMITDRNQYNLFLESNGVLYVEN